MLKKKSINITITLEELAIIHENCFLDETILNFKWLTRRVKTNFEYVVKLVNNFLYKVEIFQFGENMFFGMVGKWNTGVR